MLLLWDKELHHFWKIMFTPRIPVKNVEVSEEERFICDTWIELHKSMKEE